jgi:hypothetical protein
LSGLDQNLDKGFTSSFRDYFDNFLWARDTVKDVTLQEIGFKLTPKGTIDMSKGVDHLLFGRGDFVRFKTPTGMRVVMLMTRLGAIGLYEYIPDLNQPTKLNLGVLQSTKLAKYRFMRKLQGNDAQLEQLLLTFGYPEKNIQNLHEQIEELAADCREAGQGT